MSGFRCQVSGVRKKKHRSWNLNTEISGHSRLTYQLPNSPARLALLAWRAGPNPHTWDCRSKSHKGITSTFDIPCSIFCDLRTLTGVVYPGPKKHPPSIKGFRGILRQPGNLLMPNIVILSEAKNLIVSTTYTFKILRLTPQNDVVGHPPWEDFHRCQSRNPPSGSPF